MYSIRTVHCIVIYEDSNLTTKKSKCSLVRPTIPRACFRLHQFRQKFMLTECRLKKKKMSSWLATKEKQFLPFIFPPFIFALKFNQLHPSELHEIINIFYRWTRLKQFSKSETTPHCVFLKLFVEFLSFLSLFSNILSTFISRFQPFFSFAICVQRVNLECSRENNCTFCGMCSARFLRSQWLCKRTNTKILRCNVPNTIKRENLVFYSNSYCRKESFTVFHVELHSA